MTNRERSNSAGNSTRSEKTARGLLPVPDLRFVKFERGFVTERIGHLIPFQVTKLLHQRASV